jgi:hypothetical protein
MPGMCIDSHTHAYILAQFVSHTLTSWSAQKYPVDDNRLRFRFEGVTRRTSGGSNSISVSIVISPPPTLNTQYGLSCSATSGSTCASAQASLQGFGVSSDRCSVLGGVLRAVVWGNETALQSSLSPLCQNAPILSEWGGGYNSFPVCRAILGGD